MIINWDCCGSGPHTSGETRLYPLGSGGNLILCRSCWDHENQYRRNRGRSGDPNNWPTIDWSTAEIYPEKS